MKTYLKNFVKNSYPAELLHELSLLRERLDYLEYENSRLSATVRFLAAANGNEHIHAGQTRESFDFQWGSLPSGRFMLDNEEFRKEAPGYVCQFTSFSPDWFKGKDIIDVGCGSGRYSWALGELGAKVTSIDQSEHGLAAAKKACFEHHGHKTIKVDLLKTLPELGTFDLVWCFGVLHHTGDTYGAFKRIVPLVKPGGYIFLMLYGEPRKGNLEDYVAVNDYELWRMKTRNMAQMEKIKAIEHGINNNEFKIRADLHGYFDAISPRINDLYRWDEIESWLLAEGFSDIKRTVDVGNHHAIARNPEK